VQVNEDVDFQNFVKRPPPHHHPNPKNAKQRRRWHKLFGDESRIPVNPDGTWLPIVALQGKNSVSHCEKSLALSFPSWCLEPFKIENLCLVEYS